MRSTLWIVAVVAIVLIWCGLRIAASMDAFWIDEIISWKFARGANSILDLFTRVHSDNNHHLNTIWMYLVGDVRYWQLYRIPAIATGTVAAALCAALARK